MHKTAILNRDENINDRSSRASLPLTSRIQQQQQASPVLYMDPASVKSGRSLILGKRESIITVSNKPTNGYHSLKKVASNAKFSIAYTVINNCS